MTVVLANIIEGVPLPVVMLAGLAAFAVMVWAFIYILLTYTLAPFIYLFDRSVKLGRAFRASKDILKVGNNRVYVFAVMLLMAFKPSILGIASTAILSLFSQVVAFDTFSGWLEPSIGLIMFFVPMVVIGFVVTILFGLIATLTNHYRSYISS